MDSTGRGAVVLFVVAILVVGGIWWHRPREATIEHPPSGIKILAPASRSSRMALQRIENKMRIIQNLLDGELTLLEAAAWFRFLNENPPEHRVDISNFWPGASDGEKACRQVIGFARAKLVQTTSASDADATLARLEDELNQHLAGCPIIELPW